ncbi:CUB domain-containing protein-like protein, partial [Leptotrombidium deliense]
ARGCPTSVVRIWKDFNQPPVEICGGIESLTNETRELISTTDMLKISFISSEKAIGSPGFKASYTELKADRNCVTFRCAISGHCIANELRCNGIPNCGLHDKSDEIN